MADIEICKTCPSYTEQISRYYNGVCEWSCVCGKIDGLYAVRHYEVHGALDTEQRQIFIGLLTQLKINKIKWCCGFKSKAYKRICKKLGEEYGSIVNEYSTLVISTKCDRYAEQMISKWSK